MFPFLRMHDSFRFAHTFCGKIKVFAREHVCSCALVTTGQNCEQFAYSNLIIQNYDKKLFKSARREA